MGLIFENDGARLLKEQCRNGEVGGFMVTLTMPYSETIYAVLSDGRVYVRVSPFPDRHFAAPASDWMRTAAVAPDAEWIGCYLTHLR